MLSLQSSAADKVVRLAAAEWCPYTCSSMSNKGIITEYIATVLAKHNVQLEVVTLPWNRAISLANSGKIDGLLTAVRSEAPNLQFTHTPTSEYRSCFMSIQGISSKLTKQNINKAVIGYTANYGYGEEIDNLLKKVSKKNLVAISGTNSVERLIKMNAAKRIEYFVEEELVASYTAKSMRKKLASHICGDSTPFYMAFNPEFEKTSQLIAILDEEFKNNQQLLIQITNNTYLTAHSN